VAATLPAGSVTATSDAAAGRPPTDGGEGAADVRASAATAGRPMILGKGVGVADGPADGAALAHLPQRRVRTPRQRPPHAVDSPHATRSRCSRHRRGRHSYAMGRAKVRGWGARQRCEAGVWVGEVRDASMRHENAG